MDCIYVTATDADMPNDKRATAFGNELTIIDSLRQKGNSFVEPSGNLRSKFGEAKFKSRESLSPQTVRAVEVISALSH